MVQPMKPSTLELNPPSTQQVMRRVNSPLPDPHNVPIQPTRLLLEKASKRGLSLKFDAQRQEDHSFIVHAYINNYLLARCAHKAVHCYLTLIKSSTFAHLHKALFQAELGNQQDVDVWPGRLGHLTMDIRVCCSAFNQPSKKVGSVQAARLGLERWDPEFDYRSAAGQAFDAVMADVAAEFVKAPQQDLD